jgi:uncharacterized protein (TIGR02145 family)
MKTRFVGLANGARAVPDSMVVAIFLTAVVSCSTTNQIRLQQTRSPKLNDSLLVDRDGNRYTIRKMLDNNLWMTANLKLNIPDSYCYENVKENCEQYGRLYTWESAQKGCSLLGPGWRLPTNDEWQQLTKHYSFPKDSIDYRKRAYKALLYGGSAGFNALLSGGRSVDGKYARLGAHGFYWTATESDSSTAWLYNFGKGGQFINRHNDGEKSSAISVRCIKKND